MNYLIHDWQMSNDMLVYYGCYIDGSIHDFPRTRILLEGMELEPWTGKEKAPSLAADRQQEPFKLYFKKIKNKRLHLGLAP